MDTKPKRDEVSERLWAAWQQNLDAVECPADAVFTEPIQKLIEVTRGIMRDAGWTAEAQHDFLATLLFHIRRFRMHTSASKFVQLLQIETEYN
jgi:hypothetical protein